MERVQHIQEELIPFEVREVFSRKKGILDNNALEQCGMNKQGNIVCYDYGVEDAIDFDETEFLKYLKELQPLTDRAVKEFQESLASVSQTTLSF
jgi:hypothetical protein